MARPTDRRNPHPWTRRAWLAGAGGLLAVAGVPRGARGEDREGGRIYVVGRLAEGGRALNGLFAVDPETSAWRLVSEDFLIQALQPRVAPDRRALASTKIDDMGCPMGVWLYDLEG